MVEHYVHFVGKTPEARKSLLINFLRFIQLSQTLTGLSVSKNKKEAEITSGLFVNLYLNKFL